MKREEILALGHRIIEGQESVTRYVQHYTDFLAVPRCKKGIAAFLTELFNHDTDPNAIKQWKFDYPGLMIKLTSGKSELNSDETRWALRDANVETESFKELTEQRKEFMNHVIDYALNIRVELEKSDLADARERQVYLRRAIARLITLCFSRPLTTITVDQWSEVQPYEYCDYLSLTMDELTARLRPNAEDRWVSVTYENNGLDRKENVLSIMSFLDYLDTFLLY